MKNQQAKKIPLLAMAGLICAVSIGTPQVIFAKQASSTPKAVTQPTKNNKSSNVEIGQKCRIPELKLKENTYVLDYKQSEITGDNIQDNVILVGTKEKLNGKLDTYARDLSIIIQDGKTKKYVKYDWIFKGSDGKMYREIGREPNLIIGDYTGNKVNDIIVTAPQGGNGGFVDHLILTGENLNLKDVMVDNQALYENSQAKFSVKLPASWNGHYKVNPISGAEADKVMPFAKHVVQFEYVTKDNKDSEIMMMISVFTKTDWSSLSNEDGPPVGSVIAEADGMVYVSTTPQSNPFDPKSKDGKMFDELYQDLNLNKSFELIK